VADPGETPIRVASSARLAKEWSLALLAEGLPVRVAPAGHGWGVWVPAAEAERAAALLELYLRENRRPPDAPDRFSWPGDAPLRAAVVAVGGLLLFFAVTGAAASGSPWLERGAAGPAMLAGEPWRAITALTLHADTAHALSNAVSGLLFFTLAFKALGPGLGAALVVAAGALGNAVNAALRATPYLSVGASTAVFGAIGLLAGLAVHRPGRKRRPWVIAAAGLALLAMLGTGGPRTDVWAHFFGLAVGGALGAAGGAWLRRPPALPAQAAWGGVALALVAGSWALARGEAG